MTHPVCIAVLSRFKSKVGPLRLSRIVDQVVEVLVPKVTIKGKVLALDSTFIKGYSRRNFDNRQATAILNQELEEPSKPKTWVTGFI
ncbi:MAG: hypothetical protein ABSD92_08360 [Candidatus Bathyarchaeia archaeon]|jgi:hypothetical protein